MKVMQITPELGNGGAEVFDVELALALGQCQEVCEHCLVVLGCNKNEPLYLRATKNVNQVFFLNKKNNFDAFTLIKLFFLVRRLKPDCVHTQLTALYYAILPCMVLKIKAKVHTIQSVVDKEFRLGFRWLSFIAFNRMGWRPVALTKNLARETERYYNCKASCIPNGIRPTTDFKIAKERLKSFYARRIGFNEEQKIVLSVGRLVPVKDHSSLVDAFAKICISLNCCLLIVGGEREGCLKTKEALFLKIKKMPQEISERIFVLNERQDVRLLMHIATTLVHTSLYEGVPLVLLEAMSCRLPIVATRVGGVCDMLDDTSAVLVDPQDPNATAAGVRKIVCDPDFSEKLRERAFRVFSENYTIRKVADEYIELFKDVISTT